MDAATLWTGSLTFELIDVNSQPAWRLGVVLRRELVTFWRGERNLAMADRDQFRTWATTDQPPLERHDLTLAGVRGWIAVSIGDGPPAWMAPDDTLRLRSVI